ncbi:unnamed protein product [Amoebophrya sp. A25]|nr:unnamed protein product [Amoebophrya sp. A25]|eukprot:GSA25T00000465001.1
MSSLERWLVNRIQKKGVASLSQEEVSVVHAGLAAFEEEWQAATNNKLPDALRTQIIDRVQKKDASSKFSEVEQVPLFQKAVVSGDVARVRGLLGKSGTPGVQTLLAATDSGKKTVAHMAAKEGYADILQVLADHSAEMGSKDRTGRNPLHIACEYGQPKAVQLLLKLDVPAEAADGLGRNAFHLACCGDSLQSLEYLLARKPKLLNSPDRHQRTGLFYAILNTHQSGAGELLAQRLLEMHAEVNFRDAYRKTALHYACEENRRKCAILLLKHRADPAVQDGINRMTPLQVCQSESLKREIKKFLGIPQDADAAAIMGAGGGGGDSSNTGAALAKAKTGKSVEFEPAANTHQQGYGDGVKVEAAVARAPVALGLSFAQLRDRFIRLMTRVQEGGLQQYEHIKQPHLFTASWMQDVSSHQQLLGLTLSRISGPETAIRVFNLLRPPSHFPAARGDERDILAYYATNGANEDQNKSQVWDGADDPFNLLNATATEQKEHEFSQARKQELIREIFELRQQMESRDCANEELKKRNSELSLKCETYLSPEDVKGYRNELARLRAENTELDLGKQDVGHKLQKVESEARILRQEMEQQAAAAGKFKAELAAAKAQLEREMTRQGEELGWKAVKDRIELQLDELERDKGLLQAKVNDLQRKLEEKGTQSSAELQAEQRRLERRARAAEEVAENERRKAHAAQEQAVGAEMARSEAVAEVEYLKATKAGLEKAASDWEAKYRAVMGQRAQEKYGEVTKLVGLEQDALASRGVTGQAVQIGYSAGSHNAAAPMATVIGGPVAGAAVAQPVSRSSSNSGPAGGRPVAVAVPSSRPPPSGAPQTPGLSTASGQAPVGLQNTGKSNESGTIVGLSPAGAMSSLGGTIRDHGLQTAMDTIDRNRLEDDEFEIEEDDSHSSSTEQIKGTNTGAEASTAGGRGGSVVNPQIERKGTDLNLHKQPGYVDAPAATSGSSAIKSAGAQPPLIDLGDKKGGRKVERMDTIVNPKYREGAHEQAPSISEDVSAELTDIREPVMPEPVKIFPPPAPDTQANNKTKASISSPSSPGETKKVLTGTSASASSTAPTKVAAAVAASGSGVPSKIADIRGELCVRVIGASNLANADTAVGSLSDPFAVVTVATGPSGREARKPLTERTMRHLKFEKRTTHTISDSQYPVWVGGGKNKPFEFKFPIDWPAAELPDASLAELCRAVGSIHVEIYDGDLIGSEFVGGAAIGFSGKKEFPSAGYTQRVIADLSDNNGKAKSLKITGQVVLECTWKPVGLATSPPLLRSVALDSAGLCCPALQQHNVLCGELKVWVKSAAKLESFRKMFGGSSCAPFVKVHVPCVPTSMSAAGKSYPDKASTWQLPTKSGTSAAWDAEHTFFVMWISSSAIAEHTCTIEVFHEAQMSSTFLGELTFALPTARSPRKALGNSTLQKNAAKRAESGKQGELAVDIAFEPFFI